MRCQWLGIAILFVAFPGVEVETLAQDVAFRRGDVNADGTLDLTDGIFTLSFLFAGGGLPPCLSAADADDNGPWSPSPTTCT